MNNEVARVTKNNLYEIIGLLQLADIENEWVDLAKARLIGLVKGLEIILDNQPVTIGELENRQFDRATEVRIEADKSRA